MQRNVKKGRQQAQQTSMEPCATKPADAIRQSVCRVPVLTIGPTAKATSTFFARADTTYLRRRWCRAMMFARTNREAGGGELSCLGA